VLNLKAGEVNLRHRVGIGDGGIFVISIYNTLRNSLQFRERNVDIVT
jgi:hypothetical protein